MTTQQTATQQTATEQTTTEQTAAAPDDSQIDAEIKARHRAMWALGDYPAVAAEVIPALGPVLVAACGIGAGDRVLDIAAGSGNVAVPAALAGATVVASDLTPDLLDAGRARAAAAGAEVQWRTADAEALPFDDAEFDVATSCVGIMFAPHHRTAADELIRVVRPGGRIGLISWTPEGFIGEMFTVMKPYAAPPPPGAQPAPLWGDPAYVSELLGDRVDDLRIERRDLAVDRFGDGAGFRDFFKATYGPTIAAYSRISGEPERVAELDTALAALGDRGLAAGTSMRWEYLLVTATRR